MSLFKRNRRSFGFETLSERIALSANPIGSAIGSLGAEAAGEGETASVEQQGTKVVITGSDNDDVIEVDLGDVMHKITVNGEVTEYSVNDVDEIMIMGDGGNDRVSILGSDASESVEVTNGELELKSETYTVRVSLVEEVSVTAAGGSDRVVFNDTVGDDKLELRAESAEFTDGNGLQFTVLGFDRVMGFATAGGDDMATFYDTTADDQFIGKEQFSFMVGADYWNYARGFGKVEVFQENGGTDTAWLFGSSGDDQLNATPDDVTLDLSGGGSLATHGFTSTRALAGQGNDSARLAGGQNTADRFVWDSASAELKTTRANSVITTTATGFEKVEVTGGDDVDSAELRGSDAVDSLIALPEVVQLTTPTASVMAHGFRFVVAQGNGGEDVAHLEDSEFNDNYLGKTNFSYMSGPGYLNLITQFEVIDVVATNGGYDFATTQYATTAYSVTGGFASIPNGHLELTTIPDLPIAAFTQSDLENNRLVYVHNADSAAETVSFAVSVKNDIDVESSGTISISATPGATVAISSDDVTGPINSVTTPLTTNFFVADGRQHWVYGDTRSERIFGMSRARSIGLGGGSIVALEHDINRRNWDTRLILPPAFETEIATINQTPVANYDLVDGELVNVGVAVANPAQV